MANESKEKLSASDKTREAFVRALKELVIEKPFDKITVDDITQRAGKTRKAFYYHFYNKTQLLNWIFRHEFVEARIDELSLGGEEAFTAVAEYLSANWKFYGRTPITVVKKGTGNYVLSVMETIAGITSEPVYQELFPDQRLLVDVSNHAFAEAFRLVLLAEHQKPQPSLEGALESMRRFCVAQAEIYLQYLPCETKRSNPRAYVASSRWIPASPERAEENKRRILSIPY